MRLLKVGRGGAATVERSRFTSGAMLMVSQRESEGYVHLTRSETIELSLSLLKSIEGIEAK